MAEIVKSKQKSKLYEENSNKETKKNTIKKVENTKKEKKHEEKKSLWDKFMIFCNGVKSEFHKVRWTSKNDMIKYSIATIVFIVFCSLFFYGIDTIFALIQSLFN